MQTNQGARKSAVKINSWSAPSVPVPSNQVWNRDTRLTSGTGRTVWPRPRDGARPWRGWHGGGGVFTDGSNDLAAKLLALHSAVGNTYSPGGKICV